MKDHEIRQFEQEGFVVFEKLIDRETTQQIRTELLGLIEVDQFKKAGIGKHENFKLDHSQRGDFIHWIDRTDALPATTLFLERLQELVIQLNRNFYLGIRDFECHYTQYPEGTFYKRHVDRHKTGSSRIVSFVLYLNEHWTIHDGGQLRIYQPDGSFHDVQPEAGSLAIFLSEKEHEVLPTKRVRNSITGWLLSEG